MQIKPYLERMNYSGDLTATQQTLHNLQLAHLYSVPFENLSIHNDEPIVLQEDALFNKVVNRQRGGFCYELNGLFAALLQSLGFQVNKISARVASADGRYSQAFDHMALLVTLAQPWLVDVGFGDTFRAPLQLNNRQVQTQYGRNYHLDSTDETFTLWEQKAAAEWQPQYLFTTQAYQFADYEAMCKYHQTSPESHFTQKRICSLARPDGRVTLSDMTLISTSLNGARQETEVPNEAEYARLLQQHFGIVLRIDD